MKYAREAFDNGPWPKLGPTERCKLMLKVADLLEKNADELAALESLDNGKPFSMARNVDLNMAINCFRYYAGWCDKIYGQVLFPSSMLSNYV